MATTYEVKGMTCGGCARSVTKAIAMQLPNVKADVSLEEASVTIEGEHDAAAVERAVEDAGFTYGGVKGR
jgi:copper chaperone